MIKSSNMFCFLISCVFVYSALLQVSMVERRLRGSGPIWLATPEVAQRTSSQIHSSYMFTIYL